MNGLPFMLKRAGKQQCQQTIKTYNYGASDENRPEGFLGYTQTRFPSASTVQWSRETPHQIHTEFLSLPLLPFPLLNSVL